jgi:voltage-gated potassium channel
MTKTSLLSPDLFEDHALQSPLRHSVWRRVELLALGATIPAFYLELLLTWPGVARGLYALAFLASVAVVAHEWKLAGHGPGGWQAKAQLRLGVALSIGLLASASLPAGDAVLSLGARLVTAALIILRMGESVRPWFWRGGMLHLLLLAVVVMALCGVGFWWLEPQAHTYGDGLWLAFTTAATVGYGDIVPSTPAAKIFAVFVVLLGVSVLSLLTAAIAATWVQTEDRRMEKEMLDDLHKELRIIRAEMTALREAAGLRAPGHVAGREEEALDG